MLKRVRIAAAFALACALAPGAFADEGSSGGGGGGGSGITALTGDVTASGPGSAAATVVQVNGGSVPTSATVLGSNSSKQPVAATTTGTGSTVVLSIGPAVTLSNATGLPISTGVSGLGANMAAALAIAADTAGGDCTVGTSGATCGLLNAANVYGGQQSGSITTLSISTATFTPDLSNNHYGITLVHASCPCMLANPSAPVAGTTGIITITQSATGSDLISTWGSYYGAPGGTANIILSTGAGALDTLAYFVKDATHILLYPSVNFSH